MSEVAPQPVLRVRARWPRRRAGFAFGPEPRVLTTEDFGEMDIEAAKKVVAICSDPVLTVEWPDGAEDGPWVAIDEFRLQQIRAIAFPDEQDDGGMSEAMTAWDVPGDTNTLGAAGASASSDADVTTSTRENGGDADNQPSIAAPSEPVAADQDVAATAPEPTTTQFPKAAPSGRKAKA